MRAVRKEIIEQTISDGTEFVVGPNGQKFVSVQDFQAAALKLTKLWMPNDQEIERLLMALKGC